MAEAGLKKRSLVLAGHATSVALEPEFWVVLEDAARLDGVSLPALVGRVDQQRGARSLASALRLVALDRVKRGT